MSKKKAKEDWFDKKMKEVLEKYELNPKDGIQMLIKASMVIPAYHKCANILCAYQSLLYSVNNKIQRL